MSSSKLWCFFQLQFLNVLNFNFLKQVFSLGWVQFWDRFLRLLWGFWGSALLLKLWITQILVRKRDFWLDSMVLLLWNCVLFYSDSWRSSRMVICRWLRDKLSVWNILTFLSAKNRFFFFLSRRSSGPHFRFLFICSWCWSGFKLELWMVQKGLSSLNSSKYFLNRANLI